MNGKNLLQKALAVYGFLERALDGFRHVVLLLVRVVLGYGIFQAGYGKFGRMDDVIRFFGDNLHIPFPTVNAYLAASTECFGGLLLMAGVASRLISIPLAFTMVVAFGTAHFDVVQQLFTYDEQGWWNVGPFIAQGAFPYLLGFLFVLTCGPGMFSVDAAVKRFVVPRLAGAAAKEGEPAPK